MESEIIKCKISNKNHKTTNNRALCDFYNCTKLVTLAIIVCASLTCKIVLYANPHTKETIFDENCALFRVRHHCICFLNITVLIST